MRRRRGDASPPVSSHHYFPGGGRSSPHCVGTAPPATRNAPCSQATGRPDAAPPAVRRDGCPEPARRTAFGVVGHHHEKRAITRHPDASRPPPRANATALGAARGGRTLPRCRGGGANSGGARTRRQPYSGSGRGTNRNRGPASRRAQAPRVRTATHIGRAAPEPASALRRVHLLIRTKRAGKTMAL